MILPKETSFSSGGVQCPRTFYTDLDTLICKNLDTDLLTVPGVGRAFRIESSAISHTR
jgi:hypothetical protein